MGGWTFVEERINSIKGPDVTLRYVGRSASASPATGSYAIHELEQKQIVHEALTFGSSGTKVSEKPAGA